MAEQSQRVIAAHTLRAERVELVDGRGTVRAALATDQHGQVSLTLFDQDAQQRAALVTERARAGLYFFTPSGTTALLLAASDPVALVTLNDHAGRPGVILSVLADGRRAVVLTDCAAAYGWLGLDAETDSEGVLNPTVDKTNRVVLTARPDGEAGFTLRDRDGLARAIVSVDAHGQAGLALLDPAGRPLARFELTHDLDARLDFFGPHHRLVWRAPDES